MVLFILEQPANMRIPQLTSLPKSHDIQDEPAQARGFLFDSESR